MTLAHEDAARKAYPDARNFEPVYQGAILRKRLVGWTFQCSKKESSIPHVGWITIDFEVTGDPRASRSVATNALRHYAHNLRKSSSSLKVSNTGAATSIGGGHAVTGIHITDGS